MDIAENIKSVQGRITDAALRSGRRPADVTLLAVTKTQPVETIQKAYDAGLRAFGENRVQEALEKMAQLPSDIHWHLIGRLQTNKINKMMGKFALVHSVDSLELALALSRRSGPQAQEVLLEVNTSGEATKAGIGPSRALETAGKISGLAGLRLRGLMTVGPLTNDRIRQKNAFKELKGLFEAIRAKGYGQGFDVLSMGMSGDLEAAIEEGSTLVRVGTALFGERH